MRHVDLQTALNIELTDQNNQTYSLQQLLNRPLVVYFYPKDGTPGCSQETQDFNDNLALFDQLNTTVVGISKDTVDNHKHFAQQYNIQFSLLADPQKQVCNAFDVLKQENMLGEKTWVIQRSTFLLSPEGELIERWRDVKVPNHVHHVLQKVKQQSQS